MSGVAGSAAAFLLSFNMHWPNAASCVYPLCLSVILSNKIQGLVRSFGHCADTEVGIPSAALQQIFQFQGILPFQTSPYHLIHCGICSYLVCSRSVTGRIR